MMAGPPSQDDVRIVQWLRQRDERGLAALLELHGGKAKALVRKRYPRVFRDHWDEIINEALLFQIPLDSLPSLA
jgi:hypothetical protein